MVVGVSPLPDLRPVEGVRLGSVQAAIKYSDRHDLVLLEIDEGAACAAVFTQNAFSAAPVIVAKQNIAEMQPRYLLINTGYANAGTGQQGIDDALDCCHAVAQRGGCPSEAVLPFSTGVIAEPLPVERIKAGLPQAFDALSEKGWQDAANGILTTDTVPKGVSVQIPLAGEMVTITAIAKGAGMIAPNMATMLAFIATDVLIERPLLEKCLADAVAKTFNRISVDGDTSTNDACVLVATGKRRLASIKAENSKDYACFSEALCSVCQQLAKAIVRDGEGATKLITIEVNGGASEEDCHRVATAIAGSPLVKTAFFAADPNWGRILAAVGRAGVELLNVNNVAIYLDEICIVKNGARAADYKEALGQDVMSRDEVTIRVDLGSGSYQDVMWTCDLSYDYIRINAEYRT